MKKIFFFTSLLFLIAVALTAYGVFFRRDKAESINLEKTSIECENGERYTGEYLTENGFNWQFINEKLFYKGEELQKLCNPELKGYEYEMELNYRIEPVYQK